MYCVLCKNCSFYFVHYSVARAGEEAGVMSRVISCESMTILHFTITAISLGRFPNAWYRHMHTLQRNSDVLRYSYDSLSFSEIENVSLNFAHYQSGRRLCRTKRCILHESIQTLIIVYHCILCILFLSKILTPFLIAIILIGLILRRKRLYNHPVRDAQTFWDNYFRLISVK